MPPKTDPYFVTIVSTEIAAHDPEGYAAYRAELSAVVAQQPGFMSADNYQDGLKTLSLTYWETQEAMTAWSRSEAHQEIKKKSSAGGWLQSVRIEIAQVNSRMEMPPKRG